MSSERKGPKTVTMFKEGIGRIAVLARDAKSYEGRGYELVAENEAPAKSKAKRKPWAEPAETEVDSGEPGIGG